MFLLSLFLPLLTKVEANDDVEVSFEQAERNRKVHLLQVLCLIIAGGIGNGVLVYLVLLVSFGSISLVIALFTQVVGIVCALISFRLARAGHYSSACWLLIWAVSASIISGYWVIGTDVLVVLAFFAPLSLAIVLMTTRQIILLTILVVAFNINWYVGQHYLGIIAPALTFNKDVQTALNLFVIMVVVPVVIALLVIPARSQMRTMQKQHRRLQLALTQSEARQHTGQVVSQQVISLAAQLNTNASQQASGSQEQASVVNQLNASVSELSATATNIESLAVQVGQSATSVATDISRIEKTISLAASHSIKGLASVQTTVAVSAEAAALYQQLLATMTELKSKNANMRVVLDLLGTIASETHLLSLNAAIEAAGAGQYGERFGVVAQEVKNLAARSALASREVVGIVEEVERATQMAVAAAQSGYLKTSEMAAVAHETGLIIGEVRSIAQESQVQVSSINEATQEVKQLTEIIQLATAQQRSASEQVLQALRNLQEVATQSAEGSSLVSLTAFNLEELSQDLNLALVA